MDSQRRCNVIKRNELNAYVFGFADNRIIILFEGREHHRKRVICSECWEIVQDIKQVAQMIRYGVFVC